MRIFQSKQPPKIELSSVQEGIVLGSDAATGEIYVFPMRLVDGTPIHIHILGNSGSGKTNGIKILTQGLLVSEVPFALFEIEGPLHKSTMNFLAWNAHLARNVVEFNLSDPRGRWPGLNPLARFPHSPQLDVHVQHLLEAFAAVWDERGKSTPLLRRMLRNVITVLIEHQLTIMDSHLLLELGPSETRRRLAEGISNRRVQRDLLNFDGMRPAQQLEQIGSLENRLAEFTDSAALNFVMRARNVLDIKDIVENRKTLLINLSQEGGHLYQDSAFLIAAILISMFVAYALTRSEEDGRRRPYWLVLDEGANYVAGGYLGKLLDQARKRGLLICFGHQHLAQLYEQDRWLYHSIMANAQIKMVFRLSDPSDVEVMERQMFIAEHDLHRVKHQGFQGNEASPLYWSLPELRYLNQAKLHNQETGQMVLKILSEPPRIIQMDEAKEYPHDEVKLTELREMIWRNQAQYYLSEHEILQDIEQRRLALEGSAEERGGFGDTKRANLRRRSR